MATWHLIDDYDQLPRNKRPEHAVFFFTAEPGLAPVVAFSRRYGHRTCTHWLPLNDWQPIEAFDALSLSQRPERVAFLFAATPPPRGSRKRYGLKPFVELSRNCGQRVCTRFCVYPPLPSS